MTSATQSAKSEDCGPAVNTDREIWRERPGDFYSDSIHVTASGSIGIDCGGLVFVMPVRGWHRLAAAMPDMLAALVPAMQEIQATVGFLVEQGPPAEWKSDVDRLSLLVQQGNAALSKAVRS